MTPLYMLLLLLCPFTLCTGTAIHNKVNNLTPTQFLQDPEFIVSNNGNYKLGFFNPPNTTNKYVGIWYNNVKPIDIFWVANRNNPIRDSSGVLKIANDGNLQVLNGKKHILWSSNMSVLSTANNNVSLSAQLLDTGNLVLKAYDPNDKSSVNGSTTIWQSFDYPVDSILPNTKFTITPSNMKRALRPWKSPSDPSIHGRFSVGTDSLAHPQVIVWDGDRPYWRSGPWNGNLFLGLLYTNAANNYANLFITKNDKDGTVDSTYIGASSRNFSHYEFGYDGTVNEKWWDGEMGEWQFDFRAPKALCDFYGVCGDFGICSNEDSPVCRCLKGFKPKNSGEWNRGNWSSGCIRTTPLECGIKGSNSSKDDGFLTLSKVKLPDHVEWIVGLNEVECRTQCLQNCSCLAYAYDTGAGCMYWSQNLIDIQEFSVGGLNVYLRLPQSLLGKSNHHIVIIVVAMVLGAAATAILMYFLWRWMALRKDKKVVRKKHGDSSHPVEFEELPIFDFQDLVIATNDFQFINKLGQGGFGSVYKGNLKDGCEIAIKRLSAASGQGLEQFMNEVVVISKLQHRNLVKLLGCCVEREEKLLIYEYMPNKSLDLFLFDTLKRQLLTWEKRFNIIEGIIRGLVYLHRDSRLRIIHRDLKASNVLLDENLNPKISDFGMARIFSHTQDQDNTRRVVGTYGYMSPEYAMGGHFSEKSDVYSFGVLLIEIVTGKKSNSFWFDEESLTLLGYVWKLWNESEIASIIDAAISDPIIRPEVLRCIQVGLLCVQEFAGDRPNINTVLSMVVNDIANLPCPKQPGFTRRLISSDHTGSSQLRGQNSVGNNVSITDLIGR